jgi:hypothetical protein
MYLMYLYFYKIKEKQKLIDINIMNNKINISFHLFYFFLCIYLWRRFRLFALKHNFCIVTGLYL